MTDMTDMTDRISHAEAHKLWSEKQLTLFREMGTRERVNAVKSGALDHWTEITRGAALDLLGEARNRGSAWTSLQTRKFEPAHHPLPQQARHASRFDLTLIAAGTGWAAMMIAVAVHAYGI